MASCAVCETRRPRRFCPGVKGDICAICCGREREVTVSCPLDCPHLEDARRHDKPVPIDPEQIPNRDIRVTEEFLSSNDELLTLVAGALANAAFGTPGAVDLDLRGALESLVQTYRTLQSGVYYESLPTSPLAANIYRLVQGAVAQFRQEEPQRLGMSKTRDADVLGILVFFQRLELDRNNGRSRSRAFLSTLLRLQPEDSTTATPVSSSPLILP